MTDVFSWGDSDPFEEDDVDSWMSEPESVCNNWRGWKKAPTGNSPSASGAAHLGPFLAAGPSNAGAGTSNGLADYPAAPTAALNLNGEGNSISQTMSNRLAAAVANAAASAAVAASSYAHILNSSVTSHLPPPPYSSDHLLNPHRPSSPTYDILNSSLRGEFSLSLSSESSLAIVFALPVPHCQCVLDDGRRPIASHLLCR